MRGFITLTRAVLEASGPYAWKVVADGFVTFNVDHIVTWSVVPEPAGTALARCSTTTVLTSTKLTYRVVETPEQIASILHAVLGGHAVETP